MNLQPRAKCCTAHGKVLRQPYGAQRKQGKDCHDKKGIRDYGTISWGYLETQGKDCGSNSEKKIKKSLEGFEQMSIKI